MLQLASSVHTLAKHEERIRNLRNLADAGLAYGFWQSWYKYVTIPSTVTRTFGPGQFTVTITNNSASLVATCKVVSTAVIRGESYTATRIYPNVRPNIYAADSSNNRIVRIDDITGRNWVALGSKGSGTNQFNLFAYISFDSTGRIYIADDLNSRIVRIDDMTGKNWTTFGSLGSGINQFTDPIGITLDCNDRIYIGDRNNNRVVRIDDMTGTNWTTFGSVGSGTNQFNTSRSINLDIINRIYIDDSANSRMVRIDDMSGKGWMTYGSFGSGTNQFNWPFGFVIH